MTINRLIITALAAAVWILGPATTLAQAPTHQKVVWSTLAKVKESTGDAGRKVEFSPEVAALDRRRVAIQGFRVPLEVKTHFLVASKATDCAHCIDGGPESYVEVFSREPMKPTFGRPLTVTGKLELLTNDPSGVLYRLVDAELVSVD